MSDTPLARTWTVTIDGTLYVSKDGKFVPHVWVEPDKHGATSKHFPRDFDGDL